MTRKELTKQTMDLIKEVAMLDRCYQNWDNTNYASIPFCCYGDYDSSCGVERANVQEFMKMFRNIKGVKRFFSDYGSVSVVVDFDKVSLNTMQRIYDIVANLAVYPAINDEAVSAYEYKAILNAWYDYKNEIPYGLKQKAYKELKNNYSQYACIEMGGNVYIDTELLVKYL